MFFTDDNDMSLHTRFFTKLHTGSEKDNSVFLSPYKMPKSRQEKIHCFVISEKRLEAKLSLFLGFFCFKFSFGVSDIISPFGFMYSFL